MKLENAKKESLVVLGMMIIKQKNLSDNGYAPSYYECLDCNNSDNYYCLDMNRTTCKHIPNINLSLYYPMEKKDFKNRLKSNNNMELRYSRIRQNINTDKNYLTSIPKKIE